ncbi:NADH dehydrogenase [ubiquinone] 1 alpha subcomplex subunit [Venustampulla echinocandica]|uniref:NADH dehydrogenase [ubiquinone] 1 alpha subcomplex subunit n=1 Tax=Venustampulla echinocandica TaxID=2656787 RepID=A0A370TJ29_9HELO|nr:NADH dehydrogenase [ubiquinone] 1 alpha subcomplex subunit [Venustampulla echinocandica]RDL35350.1 NADH dehydrogenase [ubiquinone] 1 alpha subcomplex subunit [Venustampulla echinocandica]
MSTLTRSWRHLRKAGIRDALHQMQHQGDTKAGILVGKDRWGNKFFENVDELPLRTRWVDYRDYESDASQIDPGWHAWISYMVDKPPAEDPIMRTQIRTWEESNKQHVPNMTATRSAYKPYSTTKSKSSVWIPEPAARR